MGTRFDWVKKHGATIAATGILLFAVGSLLVPRWSRSPGTPYSGSGTERVRVVFSGGHYTDPVDRGRPVILIAAALGVTPDVFRTAFRGVRPAHGLGPTGDEARANKAALMGVLRPHGVTNEWLDTVSNYYRYQPQRGGLWRVEDAVAYAQVESGTVVGFEIETGGSGYSSSPRVSVPGLPGYETAASIRFSPHFEENGDVTAIALPGRYVR